MSVFQIAVLLSFVVAVVRAGGGETSSDVPADEIKGTLSTSTECNHNGVPVRAVLTCEYEAGLDRRRQLRYHGKQLRPGPQRQLASVDLSDVTCQVELDDDREYEIDLDFPEGWMVQAKSGSFSHDKYLFAIEFPIVLEDDESDTITKTTTRTANAYMGHLEIELEVAYYHGMAGLLYSDSNVDLLCPVTIEAAEEEQPYYQVECSQNIQTFSTKILSDMQFDPNALSENERLAVEGAFSEVYNTMAFQMCDDEFRRITTTKLDTSTQAFPGRRKLESMPQSIDYYSDYHNISYPFYWNQTSNITTNATDKWTPLAYVPFEYFVEPDLPTIPLSTVFTVHGECRNCMSDGGAFQLFDDSFERRKLSSSHPLRGMEAEFYSSLEEYNLAHPPHLRHLQFPSSDGTCICLDGVEPSSNRPSIDQFQQSFVRRIVELEQAGVVTSVIDYGKTMVEAQSVDCGNSSPFHSIVFTNIKVQKLVTQQQKRLLEETFRGLYNSMVFKTCDGYLRSVEDVNFLLLQELRGTPCDLPNATEIQFGNDTSVTFAWPSLNAKSEELNATLAPVAFVVKGICKGCEVNKGHFALFDDDLGGRFLEAITMTNHGLYYPDNRSLLEDSCFCSANATAAVGGEGRAPTISEFQKALNDELESLRAQNMTIAFDEIETTVEFDGSNCEEVFEVVAGSTDNTTNRI